MRVHIYRNNRYDNRTRAELHFCSACGGWYGVSHDLSHCQRGHADWRGLHCACRFCCERDGRPVEGQYGRFTEASRWQP